MTLDAPREVGNGTEDGQEADVEEVQPEVVERRPQHVQHGLVEEHVERGALLLALVLSSCGAHHTHTREVSAQNGEKGGRVGGGVLIERVSCAVPVLGF